MYRDLLPPLQVYLVAGGIDAGFKNTFSSSEVYREGRWSTVGPLPAPVHGLKGVTVDNVVFMTGQVLIHTRCTELDTVVCRWI